MNYVFVDESGDPGKPYIINERGEKIYTGASLFYIISALPITTNELFSFENRIIEIKQKFGYKKEIKSTEISLGLYKALLNIFNELDIKIFYRLINKETYKGTFAVKGNKKLQNVFDNYNLAKVVSFAIKERNFIDTIDTEVVIDRTERRLFNGKFDSFNNYLMSKVNTKTIRRVKYITHVSSEYVYLMQISDLISGAIKEWFTGKNKELKFVINRNLTRKIW